jgi:hypothetical protein
VAFFPHKGSRSHAPRYDRAELVYVLMRAESKVKPSEDLKMASMSRHRLNLLGEIREHVTE